MALLLRVAGLGGEALEVAAPLPSSVRDVKEEVEELTGLLGREQRLVSGLVELKDEEDLGEIFEQNVREATIVHLTLLRRAPEQAFWLEEVRSDGRKLKEAPPEIQADEEVVLAAVKNNCSAFRSASEELRANREVVLSAIQVNGNAFRYASPQLQGDIAFIIAAVRRNACSFNCASEVLKGDREVVMAAVKENGDVLRFASVGFRGDRALVLAAVAGRGAALQHTTERLRGDRELVAVAVGVDGMALRFASPELKADRAIVLSAISNSGLALQFACESLRADRELARAAVEQEPKALRYVAAQLQAEHRLCGKILDKGKPSGEDLTCRANSQTHAAKEAASEPFSRARLAAGQMPRPVLGKALNRQQLPLLPPHLADMEREAAAARAERQGSSPHVGAELHQPLNPAAVTNGFSAGAGLSTKRPRIVLRHHPMSFGTQLPPQLLRSGLAAAVQHAGEQPTDGGSENEGHGASADAPGETDGLDQRAEPGSTQASAEASIDPNARSEGQAAPTEGSGTEGHQSRSPAAGEEAVAPEEVAEPGALGGGEELSRPVRPGTARPWLRAALLRICGWCASGT